MPIAKIIEVVASSANGWEDAVKSAVKEASRTLRGISGVDVQDWTAKVENDRIVAYKANVKIAFSVEAEGGKSGKARR
jgi:flavin-binding protein dodecin